MSHSVKTGCYWLRDGKADARCCNVSQKRLWPVGLVPTGQSLGSPVDTSRCASILREYSPFLIGYFETRQCHYVCSGTPISVMFSGRFAHLLIGGDESLEKLTINFL